MARSFFKSSWGSVRLWLSRISTSDGRKQVVKEYSRGDLPDIQDRGKVPKRARCSILFDSMIGDDIEPIDRLELLLGEIEDSGTSGPKLFVHPVHGSYLAVIEDFEHEIDDSGTITASATFLAAENVGAVAVAPVGVSLEVDSDTLLSAADDLDLQLAEFEIPSTLPAAARSLADRFQRALSDVNSGVEVAIAKASPIRDVLVGVASITDQLWQEMDTLKLAADTALWPVFRAYVTLGEAVRAAGVASTPTVDSLITVRIDGTMSLWSLLARTYGARDAPRRRGEVMSLNDLRTPGRIETGTILRMPRP